MLKSKKLNNKLFLVGLDFLYPIFKRFLTIQAYRYLAVGGICFCINFAIFTCSLKIYLKYDISLNYLPSYWIALITTQIFTITFGFYLCYNYVFIDSNLSLFKQFSRYSLTNLLATIITMFNLYVLISLLKQNAHLSYICSTVFVQAINYIIQTNYSFKR